MRVLALWVLLLAQAAAQTRTWTPGEFRGLKLGTASVEDVQRVLGLPDDHPSTNRSDVLVYKKKGDNDGNLELEFRNGLLFKVTENLSVAMPRTVAFRKYGKDYVERRYASARCAGYSGDALLYRSPRGQIELLEYPQRGLLLWPDQFGYDIASVVYRASPLATRKPSCTALSRKQPRN